MLKETITKSWSLTSFTVLILILMEHAQRVALAITIELVLACVLILILMEHAQREHFL